MTRRGFVSAMIITLALAALVMTGILAAWALISTRYFLDTKSLAYEKTADGWEATFVRETPRGSVFAEWATEIRPIGTDSQCSASGRTEYEERPSNTVSYTVSPILARCLDMPGPKLVVHRHWVSLGPLRLRPAELDYLIGKDGKIERLN